MSYCPLAFKMPLAFFVLSHKLASNSSRKEFHETYTEYMTKLYSSCGGVCVHAKSR